MVSLRCRINGRGGDETHKKISCDKLRKLITASKSTNNEHKDMLHNGSRLLKDEVGMFRKDAVKEISHCFSSFRVV